MNGDKFDYSYCKLFITSSNDFKMKIYPDDYIISNKKPVCHYFKILVGGICIGSLFLCITIVSISIYSVESYYDSGSQSQSSSGY